MARVTVCVTESRSRMRVHEPFSVFPRAMPSGRVVWYYRAYDEQKKTCETTAHSTGVLGRIGKNGKPDKTGRAEARGYCRRLMSEGRLIEPERPAPVEDPTFGELARDFWAWEGPYVQACLQFSDPKKPRITRRFADSAAAMVRNHMLPHWRRRRLSSITPLEIETWALQLRDDGLSGKRVNDIVSCFRTMLKEAARSHKLAFDPGQKRVIRSLGSARKRRGCLTAAEARALFADEAIGTAWKGRVYRAVNFVAAATGMRQGEILAIRDADVRPGYLHVAHSWDAEYGLGPTKDKEIRDVPLPPRVAAAIAPLLGSGGYVFSYDGGERPCSGNRATEALYEALAKIGISAEERKARNITFHSWRHWLNTALRAHGVPDSLVREITGHATEAMTERYTDFLPEHFAPVAEVQRELFG